MLLKQALALFQPKVFSRAEQLGVARNVPVYESAKSARIVLLDCVLVFYASVKDTASERDARVDFARA